MSSSVLLQPACITYTVTQTDRLFLPWDLSWCLCSTASQPCETGKRLCSLPKTCFVSLMTSTSYKILHNIPNFWALLLKLGEQQHVSCKINCSQVLCTRIITTEICNFSVTPIFCNGFVGWSHRAKWDCLELSLTTLSRILFPDFFIM